MDLILTNRPRSFQNSSVVERGLSDFHKMCVTVMKMCVTVMKMCVTVMKMYYYKQKVSVITYRRFKYFSNIRFMQDLAERLAKFLHYDNIPSNLFTAAMNIILEKHPPTKKKYVTAKHAPFITKTLCKNVMKGSRLRNNFLSTKSDVDNKAYNKQCNYIVSLLKK